MTDQLPAPDLDKLMADLQAESSLTRTNAAVALGRLDTSSEQIVGMLLALQSDRNPGVRNAATFALRAAAHQAILAQCSDQVQDIARKIQERALLVHSNNADGQRRLQRFYAVLIAFVIAIFWLMGTSVSFMFWIGLALVPLLIFVLTRKGAQVVEVYADGLLLRAPNGAVRDGFLWNDISDCTWPPKQSSSLTNAIPGGIGLVGTLVAATVLSAADSAMDKAIAKETRATLQICPRSGKPFGINKTYENAANVVQTICRAASDAWLTSALNQVKAGQKVRFEEITVTSTGLYNHKEAIDWTEKIEIQHHEETNKLWIMASKVGQKNLLGLTPRKMLIHSLSLRGLVLEAVINQMTANAAPPDAKKA